MPFSRPEFQWTINLGQALSAGVSAIALGTVVWNIATTQAAIQNGLDAVRADMAASKAIAIINGPRMEQIDQANKIQDERLSNLARAYGDTKLSLDRISDRTTQISIDMAEIRAAMKLNSQRP